MANANAATSPILRTNPNPKLGRAINIKNSNFGPQSTIYQEIAKLTKDMEYFREDFLGATAAEAFGATKVFQNALAGTAAAPTKLTPTSLETSSITCPTGASALNFLNLTGQKNIDADHDPFIEVRFNVDVIANSIVLVGFVDAVPASAAKIVTSVDTPAFAGGIADAAVLTYDQTMVTTKTASLVTIGTSTAVGKVIGAPTGAPWGTPTAATYVRYRMELRGDLAGGKSTAYAYINDLLVAQATGPDGGKLLTPVLWIGAATGTGTTVNVDYIEVGQQKALTPWGGQGAGN